MVFRQWRSHSIMGTDSVARPSKYNIGWNAITVLAHGMAVAAPATETIAPTRNEVVELAATAELAKLAMMSKDEWR
ncbi:hypothetical protein Tco_1321046 [Tanacetum coccineum]